MEFKYFLPELSIQLLVTKENDETKAIEVEI